MGECWEAWPEAPGAAGRAGVIVKFIDAHAHLSVQVHPSEPGRTKHEAWILLEPPSDGAVFAGLAGGVSIDALAAAPPGDLSRLLVRLPVEALDAVVVPSGCVHALSTGSLIYEASEPRDVTYRISDWGRPGRAMHLDEARAAARPISARRIPAPMAPGAHPLPLGSGFSFGLVRHVGPCRIRALPGRAYTRLRGEGAGGTFFFEAPAAVEVAEGGEVVEAFSTVPA